MAAHEKAASPPTNTGHFTSEATPHDNTQQPVKGAARDAVLNTAELLESVLFHIPARQLFTVKRVSRSFKAAVEKSTDIQSKMWFRLQEPEESWGVLGEPPTAVLISHRAGQIFGCADTTMQVARANSVFFQKPTQSADQMASYGATHLPLHPGMKPSIDAFIKGQHQPWEDMHITDPPSTSASLYMAQIEIGLVHTFSFCATVTNPSGVTLGALLRESFAQKTPIFLYHNGTACDLFGRTVGGLLEQFEIIKDYEIRFENLPIIHVHDVVIPTDAERERMKLQASRGKTGGEQRGFSFDWATSEGKTKAENVG